MPDHLELSGAFCFFLLGFLTSSKENYCVTGFTITQGGELASEGWDRGIKTDSGERKIS